jgi:DNA (cytosine-5)-methyltransferase 1
VTESNMTSDAKEIPVWSGDDVTACDLFAGAGGFSLGAHLAGIKVVAAVEFNKLAANTYETNLIKSGLAPTHIYRDDITLLDPATVQQERGLKSGCDILLGGPPCQGFSTHRLNDAGVGDPRNALLLRYFEYVRILRPTFFLVENVPGLLWSRHKAFLETFYDLAERADYALLDPVILNARDFGVPQNRKRVFLLGYDRRKTEKAPNWPPQPSHAEPGSGTGLLDWVASDDVFTRPLPVDDINNVHMSHGPALVAAFKNTPPNGGSRVDSGRTLPCHSKHRGHFDVYGRINPAKPAPTMTTACVNPSKGRFVHPTEHHGITLRQAARIQSFPDWFQFQGGLMAGGVQVGNAVPVDLAKALLVPLRVAALEIKAQTFSAEAA